MGEEVSCTVAQPAFQELFPFFTKEILRQNIVVLAYMKYEPTRAPVCLHVHVHVHGQVFIYTLYLDLCL